MILSCSDLIMVDSLRGTIFIVFTQDKPSWFGKGKVFEMEGHTLTFEKQTTWKDDYPEYGEYFAKQEKQQQEQEKFKRKKQENYKGTFYPYH